MNGVVPDLKTRGRRVRAAKKVLPNTMTRGVQVRNFPNSPENPNRTTAM